MKAFTVDVRHDGALYTVTGTIYPGCPSTDRSKPPCQQCGAMTAEEAEEMCISMGCDYHGAKLFEFE